VGSPECLQESGRERERGRGGEADSQAGYRSGAQLHCRVVGAFGGGECRACVWQPPGASVGQGHRARGALEQPQAQDLLQLCDPLAQTLLNHVQPAGGASEVEVLHDSEEVAQVPQLE